MLNISFLVYKNETYLSIIILILLLNKKFITYMLIRILLNHYIFFTSITIRLFIGASGFVPGTGLVAP